MKLTDSTAAITSKSPSVAAEAARGQSLSLAELLRKFGWQGALLVVVMIGLYAPVLVRLVRQWWTDANYSHGLLVPLLSAYLIWQRRDKLAEVVRKPSNWGLLVVFGSLGLLFLGSLGAELFLTRISIIGTRLRPYRVFCGMEAAASYGISADFPAVRNPDPGNHLR
jgi:hypothetical protein